MTNQRMRFLAMSLNAFTSHYFNIISGYYNLYPVATRYTSRERDRDESGFRTLTVVNALRTSFRKSSNPSPWNTLTTNEPFGFNTSRHISNRSEERRVGKEC